MNSASPDTAGLGISRSRTIGPVVSVMGAVSIKLERSFATLLGLVLAILCELCELRLTDEGLFLSVPRVRFGCPQGPLSTQTCRSRIPPLSHQLVLLPFAAVPKLAPNY